MIKNPILTLIVLCLVGTGLATAQSYGPDVPDSLSFQGYMSKLSGVPLDTTMDITFTLFKDGGSVWSETKTGVVVSNGIFNVILGSPTTPLSVIPFNGPMELGISAVGHDILPKVALTPAAYALGLRGLYAIPGTGGAPGDIGMNIVGGASNNYVADNVTGATISGGGGWAGLPPEGRPDSVLSRWGTVGGGMGNTAGQLATVGGGNGNKATGNVSTVSGGAGARASADHSTVGGGRNNVASGDHATVGGGDTNVADGQDVTVGGGNDNMATANGSTIGGGSQNRAAGLVSTVAGGNTNYAAGFESAIGGGGRNVAATNATVGGGDTNIAGNTGATVPGGAYNKAMGEYSLAAGYHAIANHEGSFVWNDRSEPGGVDSLKSTDANQFLIRAAGGVGIGTNQPATESLTISRPTESAAYQLEIRNDGDIHAPNYTGIAFTQTAGGSTQLGSIKLVYHSNGYPDMSFGVRGAADALFIESASGDVGIGTTSPSDDLEVNGGITAVAVTETSDARMKRDVAPIRDAMSLVKRLRGVTFDWDRQAWPDRKFDSGRQVGLIAQEVTQVVPEVVEQGDDGYFSVAYAKLVPILIEAIKEEEALIASQNERIAALEAMMRP